MVVWTLCMDCDLVANHLVSIGKQWLLCNAARRAAVQLSRELVARAHECTRPLPGCGFAALNI